MPTEKKSTTPRFSSDGSVVHFATAQRLIPYAVTYDFPWATDHKAHGFWDSAEGAARQIADALNEAEKFEWTGEGPTAEEVGEETLLAWDGYGWNYAVFEGDPAIWWWRDGHEPVRPASDPGLGGATHWRRVLKPPVAVSSER